MTRKRYIITFVEPVAEAEAMQALGAPKARAKDAIDVLASADPPGEQDLLALGEAGIYMKNMTEEEADRVRNAPRVAEVIEDFEVHALSGCGCGAGRVPASEGGGASDGYAAGYQRALADLGHDQAGPTPIFPPRPIIPFPPIFPRPPFPPLPCPPGTFLRCRCERPLLDPTPVFQPPGWNIELVRANTAWPRATGRGVKVAVLDTGIDQDHPDLSVSGGASFVPNLTSWDDDQGHGTHCAGIIGARNNVIGVVGVAPECSLYAVKVLNSAGSGMLSWILAGMGWCEREKMEVASMSLGSEVSTPNAPCIVAYQTQAQKLIDAGCLIVAAAGNSGDQTNPWVNNPARCPGFMAVAAVDQQRNIAVFSSRGPSNLGPLEGVEISAPGVSVNSTLMGGGYGTKSGTSMACPHVSGAAALIKQLRPTWTPDQIRARLKATADDLGVPGNDSTFGTGLLNCHRAVFS